MNHSITIRFLAQLRELSGTEVLAYAVPADGVLISEVLSTLRSRPELLRVFDDVRLMMAVNHSMVREGHRVVPGDELALFPPVTGG